MFRLPVNAKIETNKTKEENLVEMIGKEDQHEQEQAELKVTDKRKFNEDGSLREGVTIEKEEPKPAPEPAPASSTIITDQTAEEVGEPTDVVSDTETEAEMPDDKDPASFINFLSTLVTNAAAALGAIPHPVSGQKTVDLDTAKYWIDVLVMLRKKTKGNLSSQEEDLLMGILSDLQLQFVSINKAAEEKLKAQAAQKFSSKDILGG